MWGRYGGTCERHVRAVRGHVGSFARLFDGIRLAQSCSFAIKLSGALWVRPGAVWSRCDGGVGADCSMVAVRTGAAWVHPQGPRWHVTSALVELIGVKKPQSILIQNGKVCEYKIE